jgi:hypothetical protein
MSTEHVIEFRNGSYFQDLSSNNGGPYATAQKFPTKDAATAFMDEHEWIYLNGGMAVPVTKAEVQTFTQALDDYILAASKLNQAWPDHNPGHDIAGTGYPEYLPSFDEFLHDVLRWREAARNAR